MQSGAWNERGFRRQLAGLGWCSEGQSVSEGDDQELQLWEEEDSLTDSCKRKRSESKTRT